MAHCKRHSTSFVQSQQFGGAQCGACEHLRLGHAGSNELRHGARQVVLRIAADVPIVLIGRDRVGEEAFGDRDVSDLKAERTHAVTGSNNTPRASHPRRLI